MVSPLSEERDRKEVIIVLILLVIRILNINNILLIMYNYVRRYQNNTRMLSYLYFKKRQTIHLDPLKEENTEKIRLSSIQILIMSFVTHFS